MLILRLMGSRVRSSISRVRCILRGYDVKTWITFLVIIPLLMLGIYLHYQKITYFLRPIWESPPKPFNIVPHYYQENVTMENLCRRVFDAVVFNNEVEMLSVRWQELSPYVDEFVLLESNSTFTGLPKPLIFEGNKEKFKFVKSRLTYGKLGGRFKNGENPFVEEAYQRVALDQLLKVAGIKDDDLLIMSDVDEIPSGHTVNLFEMKLLSLYSYEFYQDSSSWRASIHRYLKGKTRYAHYSQSDLLLADSGWHCSFCFRRISEFIFKMKAYSHSDRIRFPHFLNPKRIQDVICQGADLFDMLPEEYTFTELIGKMGNIPHSYSAVHLPAYLLNNAEEYKYLLLGNFVRESN
ncbi:hypothetical protein QQ045_001608 [Rhodiola kirilowii]